MLTELEIRLADVLGTRLPAPFRGRVRRRGAAAPSGTGPAVRLAVAAVDPLDPDFGSVRPEVLAGASDQRRIVRLGVTLGFDVETETDGDRLQQVRGLDALIYELDSPQFRSAELLILPADQGFRLDWLRLRPTPPDIGADLVVYTEGWFWPVGVVGGTGRPIERALVREFRLPVQLDIGAPLLAGGSVVTLGVALGATGTLDVRRIGTATVPFGSLALRLVDDGGGPGAGTLSGGTAGPGGHQLVAVASGSASLSYTPPATLALDHLVISAYARDADGNERIGVELARFDLAVNP